MNEHLHSASPAPEPEPKSAPATIPESAANAESPPPNKLTPEEQWALFEDDLKENDWGHRPC